MRSIRWLWNAFGAKRPRRLPGYLGTLHWGSFLWFVGFVTVEAAKEHEWWWFVGAAAAFFVLASVCLWFYGVISWRSEFPAKDRSRSRA